MRVPIYIQKRHIHLSQIDAEKLFGKEYVFSKEKNLTQPGEYITKEKLTIKGKIGIIENIDIVLPFRKFTQVEISESDNHILGTNAIITKSGELQDAESCIIIGPKGTIYLPHGVIISEKHIHMSVADAKDFGFKNNQIVKCSIPRNKGKEIENIRIRTNDKFKFDMHLNIDEGIKYGLKNNDWIELQKQ